MIMDKLKFTALILSAAMAFSAAPLAGVNAEESDVDDENIEAVVEEEGVIEDTESYDAAYAGSSVAINDTNFPDEAFRNYISENFDTDGDNWLSPLEISVVKEIYMWDQWAYSLKGIEYFTSLTYLSCWGNFLTSLDVSNNRALVTLDCSYNELTSLDLSNNTALVHLDCGHNNLTSLDVSNNTQLYALSCNSNSLTYIDLSNNPELEVLRCEYNPISYLDISYNRELHQLDCGTTSLRYLDISNNPYLILAYNAGISPSWTYQLHRDNNDAVYQYIVDPGAEVSELHEMIIDRTIFVITTPSFGISMFRLYNPNSGEHFYTSNLGERNHLISLGWSDEGIGWYAPYSSATPVYRLYNPYGGEHHYTTSLSERNYLISLGWNDEGIGWYSDESHTLPLYRQYNPNSYSNNHNYTTSQGENDWLVSLGWQAEGIGWYGVA